MSVPYKKLFLTLSIFTALHAHDAPSISTTVDDQYEPTHPVFEQLGKEAQEAVGVEKIVPIKTPKTFFSKRAAACTNGKVIEVNFPLLSKRSYGYARCVLFHEAIHVKHKDPRKEAINGLTGKIISGIYAVSAFVLLKIFRQKNRSCFLGSMTTAIGTYFAAQRWKSDQSRMMERRADTEGFRATQCELCVRETAVYMEVAELEDVSEFRSKGYIWAHEAHKIADELKGNACTLHSVSEKAEQARTWIKAVQDKIEEYKANNNTAIK